MKPDFARRSILIVGLAAALPVRAQPASPLAQAELILHETTGEQVRPYSTRDFGRDKYAPGRSVVVPQERAEDLLKQVRARLPVGLVAYVGVTNDLSRPKTKGVELAVAEGKDQFDIVRIAATDAVNYGMGTEAIIKELRTWDREFGIDIWQAETDTIQMRLKSLPKDTAAFAKKVYKFCPDIVDQGTGSVPDLARHIASEKAVLLWWD
jgi:hypothetical protein